MRRTCLGQQAAIPEDGRPAILAWQKYLESLINHYSCLIRSTRQEQHDARYNDNA